MKHNRNDFNIISQWIPKNARVLDLGCGNGELLQHLQQQNTTGYGIEIHAERVVQSIKNGVNVLQMNLDEGLAQFASHSFDYVILSLTLQAIQKPEPLLAEMLRVGKNGIITFPNFAHWRHRLQLFFNGAMPMSKTIPHQWYNTPNIHLCSIKDFRQLCTQMQFSIDNFTAISTQSTQAPLHKISANLFAEVAMFQFSKD